MEFEPTEIADVMVVHPDVHGDERGFLLETWNAERYAAAGIPAEFVQDNWSRSQRGILRGLHTQLDPAMGKLVRCVAGEIWDVAVDVRRGSETFGQHAAAALSAENFRQLWLPPGFLHGFVVLSEVADVEYKCTARYRPEGEISVAWNDPALAIRWPIADPLLSERDREAPPLEHFESQLPSI